MGNLELAVRLTGVHARDAYRLLADLERWPNYSPAIRSVTATPLPDGRVESTWNVAFLDGALDWTEIDRFDPVERCCKFRQIGGDGEYLAGVWHVVAEGDGCSFHFRADFDLGIPSLGNMLESIAEEELGNNLRSVLAGMFGSAVTELKPGRRPGHATVPAGV